HTGDLASRRLELETHYRNQLISALSEKRGKALAVSVSTLVELATMDGRELPPDLRKNLTAQLVASFDQLPVEAQSRLLQYRWNVLDQAAMLPVLRTVAERYRDFPILNEVNAYEFNQASAAALRHWYRISPADARPAVIREIVRPKPRFDARVLGMLP